MFKAAKRYHDQGLAILWLKPKSKSPIDVGWTKGIRKSWKDLARQYKPNMNVGVRLGVASNLGAIEQPKYLCAIDIDVKSTDPKHRKEAYDALKELYGGFSHPHSASGRGNGSGHIFFFTEKPIGPRRLGQSNEVVRVQMPSSDKPSKRELRELNQNDIKNGVRLRPAWEIALMGEGQQVVLAPSIHPDTNREYGWIKGEPFERLTELPSTLQMSTDILNSSSDSQAQVGLGHGKFIEVDLDWTDLTEEDITKIRDGDGVENRSDEMFSLTMRMLRLGMTDQEIVSVMTDKNNWISLCSFEHAKTSKRVKAAKWFERYTLKKAKSQTDIKNEFDIEESSDDEWEVLDNKEAEAQRIEVLSNNDWKDDIERTTGPESPPRGNLKNCKLILSKAVHKKLFARNEFSFRDHYGCNTPWGRKEGQELEDKDITLIKDWFAHEWRVEPKDKTILDCIVVGSFENRFHPVRDYLNSLEWDGTPRLGRWLIDIMDAEGPIEYLEGVSEIVLLAMVARVFQPGCKFDQVLILEGQQGGGKSSVASILASPWFNDTAMDIRDKDAMLNLTGCWVNELAELNTLRRADSEAYKSYLTRQVDRVRSPYGRLPYNIPRQNIFIGTTNDEAYLKDKTGNRRFLPVKLKKVTGTKTEIIRKVDIKLDKLRTAKDQLFAEAKAIYDMLDGVTDGGKELRLTGKAAAQSEDIQQSKIVEDIQDTIESKIRKYLDNKDDIKMNFKDFKLGDLFSDEGPLEEMKMDNYHLQLAGRILVKLGFTKEHKEDGNHWTQNVAEGGS